jgi:diguanylate cyclase (GGDEF)-like protein
VAAPDEFDAFCEEIAVMMTVVGCIVRDHNIWLVLVSAVICVAGSWVTTRLFHRAASTAGLQRIGWHVLTAVAAGAAIWCTHFIAMLGFDAGAPVGFDPVLTIVSLLIAVAGSTIGFAVAGSGLSRFTPALGGAIVGLAIVLMHYTGMTAYRVQGLVSWDMSYLVASIVLAVGLSATALHLAMQRTAEATKYLETGVLALAIASLHYTGMTAFRVEPMLIDGAFSNPESLQTLALAVAGVAIVIVGAGLASYLIDDSMRAEASEALSNMSNGLVMIGSNATIRLYNKRVCELLKLKPGEVRTGMPLSEFLEHVGAHAGWDAARTQRVIDNHAIWMAQESTTHVEHHFDDGTILSISCRPMEDGGAILTYDDVTEAREGQKKIAHMAFHDSLTGLPNRVSFSERLDLELDLAHKNGTRFALVGIDLDGFKEINDIRGHGVGDEVLAVLAQRMKGLLGQGDFVARVGGDEFAATHRIVSEISLVDFLARLETALTKPIALGDQDITPGASIGVTIYPDHATGKGMLISNADLAMYRAKSDLSRMTCFYEPEMDETIRARRSLALDLREALEHGQLSVHYQVQTSVPSSQIRGYEALLRWEHPERGFIPPSEFIPLAEENGLILQIGEWVLREACSEAAGWIPPYKVAVNLSAAQFAQSDLPKLILEILVQTGLAPERLELELTESTIFADKERSLHMLRQIKALGVSIALDDFGTGYSSLDTLRSFPFDKIKLDRSFVSEVETSPQAKAIIRAVLALGKSLSIPVLAEGIETQNQLSLLNTEGCDEAQGYYLGRPAPLVHIVGTGQIKLNGDVPAKASLSKTAPHTDQVEGLDTEFPLKQASL